MTLFEGYFPQNEREREETDRERDKEIKEKQRKRERERASWMPNDMVTAGKGHHRLNFPHRFYRWVNVRNSICLAYAKFNGLPCMVPAYRFWGAHIALQCFVHISDKQLLQY